jgi:Ca2+:H+ antiporter
VAQALAVTAAAAALIAVEADLAASALEATLAQLGLSPVFMGVVVLALVGTAADLLPAVVFAFHDRMDIVLGMCTGSAIQIALAVAPVLVLASWIIGHPMNLVFGSPLDLFALVGAAFIVRWSRRGRRDHVVRGAVAGRGLPPVRARLLLRKPGLSLRDADRRRPG